MEARRASCEALHALLSHFFSTGAPIHPGSLQGFCVILKWP